MTPTEPLPEAPKNNATAIGYIRQDIDTFTHNANQLNRIIKDLEKNDISNNAQKLILVAECHIKIINISNSRSDVKITDEQRKAPQEYLNKALRALSTHRYEDSGKYGLLKEILGLYVQIEQLRTNPADEIAASRIQCQLLSYTFKIEDTNELLEGNNFAQASETVPTLSELPPNPNLTPEHHLSIIAILNAMANHATDVGNKLELLTRIQHFARSGLEKIQRLKDVHQQVRLLKSLEAEVSKVITAHSESQKSILGPLTP